VRKLEPMGTRIIHFGIDPGGAILAALTGNGYEVNACGASIPKLKQVLQHDHFDAIAVTENGASEAAGVLAAVRSFGNVPLILFQDESRSCDPSQFDLVIPEYAPLPDLVKRVAALIERSRAIRAETKIQGERFHLLLRKAACLREQSVTACVETQRIRAKRQRSVTERVSIPCVLVVDDYARWRDTICSMLKDYADCQVICEAEDGVEAVLKATELKPRLILLDLNIPRLNGIEAARQIVQFSPDSAILFVSMDNSAAVVSEALSTGAKGYLLKTDAGKEFWLAIEAVLQNKQYLSHALRGLHSVTIN
jgi:CheY-like chemotaxis protein